MKNRPNFKINKKHKILLCFYSMIIVAFSLLSYAPSLFLNNITGQGSNKVFFNILMFFTGILISRITLVFVSNVFGERLKAIVENGLKDRLIKTFISQKYSILEKTNTESLAYSSGVNIKNYSESSVGLVENITFVVTSLAFTFVFIGLQSWILLTFTLLSFLSWIIISMFFTPKIRQRNKEMRRNEEKYAINFSKMFKNIVVTKLLNKDNFLTDNMDYIRNDFIKIKYSYSLIKAFSMVTWNLMFGISQLGLIVLAYYLSAAEQKDSSGAIDGAALTSIIYISGMLLGPIFRISQVMHDYNNAFSAIRALKNRIKDWEVQMQPKEYITIDKIEFKNVSLRRFEDQAKYLFKNINQIIEKGDFVKIEGPSGSGKTSLLSLIFNEDQNYEGSIFFNNEKNTNKNTSFVIGLIKQQSSIFPLSIRRNITFDFPFSDQEIQRALSKVGLHYLTKRLDQEINLNQTNLSGGELRRIEIARMLLISPEILILDEAFVGIDQKEKHNIVEIIKNQFKDKIILYTSHDDFISFNNKTIFINQIAGKRK